MDHKCRNWKARKVHNKEQITIDRSEESKIKLDLQGVNKSNYDDSNILVLPSKKRKTKVQGSDAPQKRKLTKKQRRLLEKVIERKEKKAKRADLLSSLEKVQIPADELSKFVSVSDMQSNRIKEAPLNSSVTPGVKTNAANRGWRKRKSYLKQEEEMKDVSEESDIHTSDMSSDDEDEAENEIKSETKNEEQCETSDMVGEESSATVEQMDVSSVEPMSSTSAETGHIKTPGSGTSENLKKECISGKIIGSHSKSFNRTKKYISVTRTQAIEEQRSKLPVVMEEQIVMEKITDNPVVIVCGETGSGKTTQVPQFLYEAGYAEGGIIGVTQPRRVAAICMSRRVAEELNLTPREVSYQIRYEGNTTDATKIKFMTDGVLLKEVQNDFLLSKYRVIVLDEAHERSVYTDILIGLLSRIVPLRHKKGAPLKLIIMSATLRVTDFTENKNLFKAAPPVIQIDSRQFPVTVHFNRHTAEDYLEEAFNKVCKIHKKLPEGGILVFVTSQQEVLTLCRRLKKTFRTGLEKCTKANAMNGKMSLKLQKKKRKLEAKEVQDLPKIDLDNYSAYPQDEEDDTIVEQQDSDTEQDPLANLDQADDGSDVEGAGLMYSCQPMHVLPMFSLLSAEKQAKVFEGAPDGCRLCVVSTNVAETSLTIPGIKYVIDTGKEKTKVYDKVTGVSTFQVTSISQASANQRTGRAGRIGPGHAYRLYSSAVFSDFEKHAEPEMRRRPVEDLILQMKDMGIDHVVNFPFPTPPDVLSLEAAEKLLVSLGALSQQLLESSNQNLAKQQTEKYCYKITSLGRTMAQFPVSPRFAKMLALSNQHGILSYVIALVAALSVQELFIDINSVAPDLEEEENNKDNRKVNRQKHHHIRKQWAGLGNCLLLGDMMVLLKAVGACEYEGCTPEFCETNGLRYKAIVEVRKLRKHLTNTVNLVFPGSNIILQPQMRPPTDEQSKLIRQVVLMGLADHVARKVPVPSSCEASEKKKLNYAYQDMSLEDPVYIHPSSVLYKTRHEFLMYQTLEETSKLYMKGIAVVEPEWLPLYAASHCQFSAPLVENPSPRYDASSGCVVCHIRSKYGPQQWQMPEVEVNFPKNGDCMRWFARFLLEGKVMEKLQPYSETLLLSPYTLIKKWAHLQPKTTRLLDALASEKVYCRDELLAAWRRKPNYLLKELKEWIPESLHDKLTAAWPPVKLQ